MFQLSAVRVRHYEFENPEDGTILHVHPPKLEAVEIFNKVFTDKESTPKDMAGVTAALLSDNEEGVRITSKKLMGEYRPAVRADRRFSGLDEQHKSQ